MSWLKSPIAWASTLIVFMVVFVAAQASNADEMSDLKKKVEELEKTQAELYHSLEEKKAPGVLREIAERVTFGGLVEVEASMDRNDKDGDTSDVVLATVELGFDAEVHERVAAHVLLLWEEDDTDPINMDEGTIEIALIDGVTFTGGKFYIPFGVFNSHFVSDPLTLELGETNESALMLSYGTDLFEASAGIFNGSVNDAGDEELQDHFASLTVRPIEGVEAGAYYTSNIADSDGVSADAGSGGMLSSATLAETVGGWGAFVSLAYGPVTLDAEYITASERFNAADLDGNTSGKGDKPQAYNVELAYNVNDRFEVAAKVEGGRDFFDFPETQYGVAASYGLFENVAVAVEFLHGEFTDENVTRDLATVQVAAEF